MYIKTSNKYGETAEPFTRTGKMAAKKYSHKIFPPCCILTPRLLRHAGALGVSCPSRSNVRKQLEGYLENLELQGQYANLHLLCIMFPVFPSTWKGQTRLKELPLIPPLCKLWRIQLWELNHKQLDLLILHPSQLSQGTDTYCTPNCTGCILFSAGEFQ